MMEIIFSKIMQIVTLSTTEVELNTTAPQAQAMMDMMMLYCLMYTLKLAVGPRATNISVLH